MVSGQSFLVYENMELVEASAGTRHVLAQTSVFLEAGFDALLSPEFVVMLILRTKDPDELAQSRPEVHRRDHGLRGHHFFWAQIWTIEQVAIWSMFGRERMLRSSFSFLSSQLF